MNNFCYPKGSIWRRWDLQTHTIFDDDYLPLDRYYDQLKKTNPTSWQQYVDKVGGEENALLYDSKAYFADNNIDKKERCLNYVRNYFAFIEIFNPQLGCIGISDHNYFDDCLLDTFVAYSKKSRCKVIPGVEINCQGIHMLVYFRDNLYQKETFSSGIHTFLIKCGINNNKKDGVLALAQKTVNEIIDELKENDGIVIYPHCNSNNGLFQERTSTDRTHLADIFNYQKVNLLQAQNNRSLITVTEVIKNKTNLTSKYCCHISSDCKSLRDVGKCDADNNYLWIRAIPRSTG